MSEPTKNFGANIPRTDYDEFKQNFPMYGATQWLITEAVREVNRAVREDVSLKRVVEHSVQRMLERNRAEEPGGASSQNDSAVSQG